MTIKLWSMKIKPTYVLAYKVGTLYGGEPAYIVYETNDPFQTKFTFPDEALTPEEVGQIMGGN
jgi:hypothetical protein